MASLSRTQTKKMNKHVYSFSTLNTQHTCYQAVFQYIDVPYYSSQRAL